MHLHKHIQFGLRQQRLVLNANCVKMKACFLYVNNNNVSDDWLSAHYVLGNLFMEIGLFMNSLSCRVWLVAPLSHECDILCYVSDIENFTVHQKSEGWWKWCVNSVKGYGKGWEHLTRTPWQFWFLISKSKDKATCAHDNDDGRVEMPPGQILVCWHVDSRLNSMNPLKHRAWCQQCAVVVLRSEEFSPFHFNTTANLNIYLPHPFTINLKYIQGDTDPFNKVQIASTLKVKPRWLLLTTGIFRNS